ncbi:MAG: hypothetical protein AAF799_20285 [Myxococcota bacterium]
MEWKYFNVSRAHDCFAPRVESNRINYRTPRTGTVKRMRMRISDADGIVVFEQEYDVANGLPQLAWDGGINQNPPHGEPPYVNPMRSPFTAEVHGLMQGQNEQPIQRPVELSDDDAPTLLLTRCHDDDAADDDPIEDDELVYAEPVSPEPTGSRSSTSFRVKFHSIVVERAAIDMMTPNVVPNTDPMRCVQLNTLGYYAGPPSWIGMNGFRGEYFTRARDRYNALLAGQALDTRLGANWEPSKGVERSTNNGWVDFAEGDDMHGAELRMYVESLPYKVAGMINGLRDQLNVGHAQARAGQEEAQLNRPLVPFEVRLLVRRSNGQGVFVREAVGKARVDWTIDRPGEHLENIGRNRGGTSRYARRYVQQAKQAIGGTAGLNGKNRRKINCTQTALGGAAVADQWKSAAVLGNNVIGPHDAQADNAKKVIATHACVDTNHPNRLGKAVFMFRPSAVAGDRYKLTAHAFFRGHNRRDALRRKNPTLKKVSGNIEIWRWAPVGVVLNWGSSKVIDNNLWDLVKPRFREAYTEIDTTNTLVQTPTQLLNPGDYTTWINGSVGVSNIQEVHTLATNAFSPNVNDNSILSLNSPIPGTLGAPNGGWGAMSNLSRIQYQNNPAKRLAVLMRKAFDSPEDRQAGVVYGNERFISMVETRARAQRPRGFVIMNLGFGNALQNAGIQASEIELSLLDKVRSCTGDRDMHVILWDHRPEHFDYIVAHEMAHCLGLRHYENAGDQNPNDHDTADHNCVMSYSSNNPAHQRPAVYSPMFCGKCNLKLRGWKVDQGLIARST